ncbi:MAG TPA: hypothetical protein ENJ35_02320 [Gammaproteobacteria bacterium]|nr:hypothetical protein [Gammaproteobacteria bacterium]
MLLQNSTRYIHVILMAVIILAPAMLSAADLAAPIIRLPVSNTPEPGSPIVISASVQDNQGLNRVLLHYRKAGSDEAYSAIPMKQAAGSRLYRATIPRAQLTAPGIEYYIEAIDSTENVSQEPFPSHPRIIAIAGGNDPVLTAAGKKINWLWVAAGVVAAGALAASSGGGSGGSDDPQPSSTLTITAPVP